MGNPTKTSARKARKPAHRLNGRDFGRLARKLTGSVNPADTRDLNATVEGVTCSAPWAEDCVRAAEAGRVPLRTGGAAIDLSATDLQRTGVYPPRLNGQASAMTRNRRTGRAQPTDYKGSPIDELEDTAGDNHDNSWVHWPSSNSAAVIEQIRHLRSRPEKGRIK